jgi:hypothetical protein
MLRAYIPLGGILILLAFAGPAIADEPLLHFAGNSWERGLYADRTERPFDDDRPQAGPRPRAVRSDRHLSAVGELTAVANPLVWNPQAFSVSWYLRDLKLVADRREGASRVSEYAGGRVTFYADSPGALPVYGIHPPNETVPATFKDGFSVYLDGLVTSFEFSFDETSGLGTFTGTVSFVGGDAYPLLDEPSDWVVTGDMRRGGPSGYSFQLSGGFSQGGDTTTIDAESWTAVKDRYR